MPATAVTRMVCSTMRIARTAATSAQPKSTPRAQPREHLEGFIMSSRDRDAPVARFVERELRAYLECGVLAHGFLRLHCEACGHDRLLAFSCKACYRRIQKHRLNLLSPIERVTLRIDR